MLSPSPVPVAAAYAVATNTLTVTFDLPLAAGTVSDDELFVNGASLPTFQQKCTAQAYGGGTSLVLSTTSRGSLANGADRVTYKATSSQLVGANGQPVAAFADFPCTIT